MLMRMSSTNTDPTLVLAGSSGYVYAVAFLPDGKHVLGGNGDGIRRWRLLDGENVGKQTGMTVIAISVSRDRKWIVCGTYQKGAGVWNGEMEEKVIGVEGENTVYAVDVSPDSTTFATGTDDGANIWSITSGQRLVDPLHHDHSILLLDTSTLARIIPVIEDDNRIWSVAISPDGSYLATGRPDGKITIRDLGKILPESHNPSNVSIRDEVQQDERPSTSGDHDVEVSSSAPEAPGESSRVESKRRNRGDNSDLFELKVSSSIPAQFNYDEQLSLESFAVGQEDEIPPVDSLSHPVSQSLDCPPVTSTAEAYTVEDLNTVRSPRGRPIFRKWLQRKSDRDPTSPKPGQLFGTSREPADPRLPTHSRIIIDATKGPSWMAAGQPTPRVAARSGGRRKDKSIAKAAVPKHPNKDTSHSGQGSAGANEVGPVQQENSLPQPSGGRVHVTRRSGDALIALRVPLWMVCFCSGKEDGPHGSR